MPSTSTNAIKHSHALAQHVTSQARLVAENRLCSSPWNRVIEAVCSVRASTLYNYIQAFYALQIPRTSVPAIKIQLSVQVST